MRAAAALVVINRRELEDMSAEAQRPARIEEADAKETGTRFMGMPDRWLDDPTWRCANGHVSKRYLKSEELGRAACLECRAQIWLTFPEDDE